MRHEALKRSLVAALSFAGLIGTGAVLADGVVVYEMAYCDPGNAACQANTGPFAKVTVTYDENWNGGTEDKLTIDFNAGIFDYLLADGGGKQSSVGINVGPIVTNVSALGYLNGAPSLATITTYTQPTTAQIPGGGFVGVFAQLAGSSSNGLSLPQTDQIIMTILGDWTGRLFPTASPPSGTGGVLYANSEGSIAAVHVGNPLTGATFTTSGHDPDCPDCYDTPVPIPAAAWLFGTGLLGLIGIARRKKLM